MRWLSVFGGLIMALTAGPTGARADEFKLVLTPELGQPPPGRVCFASRNSRMRTLRADVETLEALHEQVVCDGDGCRDQSAAVRGRCAQCPGAIHPDCTARIDPGEWSPEVYTVVCADDDTAPRDGGTLYVAVESVEAESPPEVNTLEVSGGRVRWSPLQPVRRPSYRVLGGDFESSRLTWPRRPSDRPWAEVPVRRRCRCLDVQMPASIDDVAVVEVDGEPVCRGLVGAGGLLPVEVPATARGRVRGLRVEAPDARLEMTWGDRWPSTPLEPVVRRMGFAWDQPCAWPAPEACPAASIRGARCDVSGPVDGRCRYVCRARSPGALATPVDVTFGHHTPPLRWVDVISAAGDRLTADVPEASRVVRADVSTWPRDVPGDRIRALEIEGVDGTSRSLPLPVDDEPLWVPLPGARCGLTLRTRPEGERDYIGRLSRVARGGRMVLAPPAEQVIPWDLHLAAWVGGGAVFFADREGAEIAPHATVGSETGITVRLPGRPWFVDLRAAGQIMSAWPYGALGYEGTGDDEGTVPFAILATELTAGYSLSVERNVVHLFAGGGPAMGFAIDAEHIDRLPHRAWMGVVVAGARWPLRAEMGSRLHLQIGLRTFFGGRVRRFATTFRAPSFERDDRAALTMGSVGLDYGF